MNKPGSSRPVNKDARQYEGNGGESSPPPGLPLSPRASLMFTLKALDRQISRYEGIIDALFEAREWEGLEIAHHERESLDRQRRDTRRALKAPRFNQPKE